MKKIAFTCFVAAQAAAFAFPSLPGYAAPAFQASVMLAHAGHGHGGHTMSAAITTADAAKMPSSTSLQVSSCWIRSLPAPAPSAGYFIVSNTSDKPVRLLSAASSTYDMVMLHRTTHENGMSRMSATKDITIPAGETLTFEPGGYHAMLEKSSSPPAVGSRVEMAFFFDTGEKAVAQCDVKPANTRGH